MPLINAHNLSKSFSGKDLFKAVSFGIDEKERVGLVGPNGAGKSTLLKIIAQKIEADEGQVSFRKGLIIGFLEQDPHFNEEDTILSSLLSKTSDSNDSLANAYTWLAKLELTRFDESTPVSQLSGGWRKRVALARELMLNPDVLLMDEPTNHLDISSILWLEDFLNSAPFSVLMVTHDRLFLQRVVNRIMDLDPKNPQYLLSINGTYDQYLETKEQLLEAQRTREKVLRNTLRRETEWLRRGAIARQTKQKARIENASSLKEEVENLEDKNRNRSVGISFSENTRSPKKLIEVTQLSKSFAETPLFENLDLLITPKTRLALVGDNGCGKSTLIRVLLGLLPADQGQVKFTDGVKFTYFEQGRDNLNPKESVLKNICPDGDYVNFRGEHIYARSYLERFLFYSQKADLPVERLSGGEKARLRLAQIMLEDCQVLILDEPTNDLDVETLGILESALQDFNGAVILVTHDRYFMDSVCQELLVFYQDENGNKSLEKFTGYFQYENWLLEQKQKASMTKKETLRVAKPNSKVKLSFKEKFELENMEANILAAEESLQQLQTEISLPESISNATKLVQLTEEIAKAQETVETLYRRWAELEEKEKKSQV